MDAVDLLDPQTLNLYSNVGNDPLNSSDPLGTYGFSSSFSGFGGSSDRRGGGGSFGGIFNFFAGLLGSIFGGGNRTFHGTHFGPIVQGPKVIPVPGPARSTISVSSTGQEPKTESTPKLADISDLMKDRDGSSDGAPTKFHFIWYGAEENFRAALEIIEMNIHRKLVFTEMFRDTEQQQKIWDKYQEKVSKKIYSLPADKPGYSTHQCGCSFDVPLDRYGFKERAEIIRAFEEYGFIRNRSDDDVHFTFRAAADLYANDAPYLKKMIESAQAEYNSRPRFNRHEAWPDIPNIRH